MSTDNPENTGKTVPNTPTNASTTQPRAEELLVQRGSELTPVLSVVMPTLDEEEGIADCIREVKRAIETLNVTTEIIISDSSSDRTPTIAREMGAIVVEPDEKGYGYAYRYAFERARGEYLVMGDADCTYDFSAIPKLMKRILEGADIVMGSRLDGVIEPGAMPKLHQHIGNPFLTRFLNGFYGAGVSDAHSGFRVFTREALEQLELKTNGMEFASEMIMEAGARGLRIDEVPIRYRERKGDATLESFRDGWRHVKFMLMNAPGYLFSVPGILLLSVGLLIMALVSSIVDFGTEQFGLHSLIAGSLLTIVGYQITCLGIFATIAGEPIRMPTDPITTHIVNLGRLEHGLLVGFGIVGAGVTYALYLVSQWITSGFTQLPFVHQDIVAFVLIVIGIQTVFSSFFMGTIRK